MSRRTLLKQETLKKTPYVPNSLAGEETLRTLRSSALRYFWAALANRASSPVDILFVGDSKTEGQGATLIGDRWIDRVRDQLRTWFQPSGITGGIGYVPSWYGLSVPASPSPKWSYAGVANTDYQTLQQGSGLGRRVVPLLTGTGVASLTTTFTSFDLFFTKMNAAANTATINIDAAGGYTYTDPRTSGNPTVSGGRWNSVTSGPGALAAASRAITIARASGTPNFEGAMFYNGDEAKGIRVWDGAHFGYLASGFIQTAGAAPWLGAIPLIAPSLVVIALFTNEYRTGVPVATAKANALSLISYIRTPPTNYGAGAPLASFVLLAMEEPAASGSEVDTWANYVNAMYEIALADTGAAGGLAGSGVCVLDMSKRMVKGSLDTLSLHTDQVHLSTKGNLVVADAVSNFLVPR